MSENQSPASVPSSLDPSGPVGREVAVPEDPGAANGPSGDLIYIGEQRNPLLEAVLRHSQCARPSDRALAVHAADEMWLYALGLHDYDLGLALVLYNRCGISAWRLLRDVLAWRFGSAAAVPSWLDFAAGFGRVNRFATTEVAASRLTASEIDPRALDFQRRQLGVQVLPSTASPTEFAPGRAFGFVSALSFFTHTPRATFSPWLARLWHAVEPGGALFFSTGDLARISPELRALARDGFLFEARSESDDLDADTYGTAWCSADFTRARLAGACGDNTGVFLLPRGLWDHQDVWVVTKANQPSGPPPWRAGLVGYLENCAVLGPDEFVASGWAVNPGGQNPPRIELFLDTISLGTTAAASPREDVHATHGDASPGGGWRLHVRSGAPLRGNEVLCVVATRDSEEPTVLHASPLFGADTIIRRTERWLDLDRQIRTYQQRLATRPLERLRRLAGAWKRRR